MIYAGVFISTFLLAYLITPLCRKAALFFGILDHPRTQIKTHKTATPYLGGIAIWVAFFAVLLCVRLFTNFPTGTLRTLRGIFWGGSFMVVIGLLDDIVNLHYGIKFIGQIAASIILICFGVQINFLGNTIPGYLVTVLWVVGITNAFNIIDVMDGLSAGVAMMAAITFFFIALPAGQIYVIFASLAIAGACAGYLPHNWHPARIFMGDTGSLFIGFILASISVGISYTRINAIALFSPLIVLGIPIYDTLLVSFFRWRRGVSIFKGSKDHLALRLEALGLERSSAVLAIYAACAILGMIAFVITMVPFEFAALLFALTGIASVLVVPVLGEVKME